MRYFNTTGPIKCDKHYCLPPLERFVLADILELIDQEKYFVLHAPHQTGKTSYLLALMNYLNQAGIYHCLYINVEGAQAVGEDVAKTMKIIFNQLATQSRLYLNDTFFTEQKEKFLNEFSYSLLDNALTLWAEVTPKPIVLLIDEIDTLLGNALISVLRQLRSGYPKRPEFFPQSVILCGVRDVRDYRLRTDEGKPLVTGGSAFNIKSDSLRLDNFNQVEVETLYQQHTIETGQSFTPDALNLVWELTQGQPWLVNALGREVCFKLYAGKDRTQTITVVMMEQAKENLILRRETHLDQLLDKLKEKRIQRVMSPILRGDHFSRHVQVDDVQYAIDLGLVTHTPHHGLQVSNPIYQEVIPRELTHIVQLDLESTIQSAWYIASDGQLDMTKLLTDFQQFFREHAEHWVERFNYKEAGPQLLLQAFLQRIINGGGQVQREYGLGRKRTDLLVIWPYSEGTQRVVLELKILYKSQAQTQAEGLEQTWLYMDQCATTDGHLIIFDRTADRPWREKIYREIKTFKDQEIVVWGM